METLKLTTSDPMPLAALDKDSMKFTIPPESEVIPANLKGNRAYIHGDAEELAGYDIPLIFDGDLAQLDAPLNEQDIEMYLEDKVYKLKAELQIKGDKGAYYLTLK